MPVTSPRYLVPFHPKRVPHYFTDVLIVGGGLAGFRAALAVDPRLSVLVITKDELRQSSSNYAQGGIAGVLDAEDCFEDHVADTLLAGGPLCDRAVVELVVRQGPERIRQLIEWGTQFDESDGQLVLGREGGHGRPRVAHALGDATGKEVMRAVIARMRTASNVTVWRHAFTIDLLTDAEHCRGALVWNEQHGKTLVWAKQTVLCTGGAGQIYRESTNPVVATGDGMAAAFRAGAELRDMEFMQFHPTVLYIAGSGRSLITEAMRGEGARLLDCNGHRFMCDYDERGELAPRDVVAQAIVTQMEKTQYSNVFLDLSHLDGPQMHLRFPGISAACREFGIDIARDRIPVRPGAHYMIGGLTVDAEGRTTLPGLWAAGEVTSSGLHGANRLASNSLLEGLVFGAHAGEAASHTALQIPDTLHGLSIENPRTDRTAESLDSEDIRNSLKSLMWRAAAVRRDGDRLAEAAEKIEHWCRYVLVRQFKDPTGWELQNMLIVARIMIQAASRREESRGVHLRTDFPETDDVHWCHRQAFSRSKEEGSGG
jgi:L-aspartate oxidase